MAPERERPRPRATSRSPRPKGAAAPPGAVLPDRLVKIQPTVAGASTKGSTGLAYKISSAGSTAAKCKRLIAYAWKLAGRIISPVLRVATLSHAERTSSGRGFERSPSGLTTVT